MTRIGWTFRAAAAATWPWASLVFLGTGMPRLAMAAETFGPDAGVDSENALHVGDDEPQPPDLLAGTYRLEKRSEGYPNRHLLYRCTR